MTDFTTSETTAETMADFILSGPPQIVRIMRLGRKKVGHARLKVQELYEALSTLEQALTDKMNTGKFNKALVYECISNVAEEASMGFAHGVDNFCSEEVLLDAAINSLLRDGLRALSYDGSHFPFAPTADGPHDPDVLEMIPGECWDQLHYIRNLPIAAE